MVCGDWVNAQGMTEVGNDVKREREREREIKIKKERKKRKEWISVCAGEGVEGVGGEGRGLHRIRGRSDLSVNW